MTRLVIARHGNTFEEHEDPRRIGARTDMPLTEKGRAQAAALGHYLREHNLLPDVVYSSKLCRASETAEIAVRESGYKQPVYRLDIFNEIDHGPDENKTEDEVIARIGPQALKDWDERAIVPPGWQADPADILRKWHDFASHIPAHDDNETILVVTSNGMARFALHLTGDFEEARARWGLKLAPGALGILRHAGPVWRIESWNVKPPLEKL